jgi:hypothetical protein
MVARPFSTKNYMVINKCWKLDKAADDLKSQFWRHKKRRGKRKRQLKGN